ncbi:asparagine synthase (glutamine-hydrolysing) [Mucilaginibacter yixingensis]|uniref:asparagine synthase (glutamine-hydrolyzing) n=2 Tax=Mucilaginibacter yixingensis TaxID=1295612 RepID=A0A2T5JFU5_9SPHI|nr:asparagine synthase (glutamine-hydrolysing) [Mucilaginibacter yixingensis]
MCHILARGGPDDEGFYYDASVGLAFGHRRLSIIDLTNNGHQPMSDANAQTWITFNGEIYNYLELKAQLVALGATFYSKTDTEVIIQAYRHWGTAAFGKLRGMFAFALYDSEKELTWLVRDTTGIKPLYYYRGDGDLYFASEVKALNSCGLTLKTDKDWSIRFLAYGHIPEPYTTYENVFSLPKGHYLCWNHRLKSFTINKFPAELQQSASITGKKEAEERLSQALDIAVKRQLTSDAPIGIFLSGGIDSSLVTLLAAKYSHQLQTVSIYFDDAQYNERKYQQIIQQQVSAQHYQHLVKQQDFTTHFDEILADMDLPTTDGINSWFISKYARQSGLKAVLSGVGADEQFGGYPSFQRIMIMPYLRAIPDFFRKILAASNDKLKRLELLSYKHPVAEYLFLRGLFTPSEIAAVLSKPLTVVTGVLFSDKMDLHGVTGKNKAAWYETHMYMQNQLLRDTDVMSMAHGLEVRVPFLDEDVQKLIGNIAPGIKFSNKPTKKLLIKSFSQLLPKAIWNRPKMGFSFPLQTWMQEHPEIGSAEFYKNPASKRLINGFHSNKVHWSKAFALYQIRVKQPQSEILHQKVLYLTLSTFSTTGGVQKMGRTMGYALQQIARRSNWDYKFWSGYDKDCQLNAVYTDQQNFKGFGKHRALFAAEAVREGIQSDTVILSHINLAMIGCLIKKVSPKTKVFLIAHGIEIWRPLSGYKRKILTACDGILCVSNFTRDKVIKSHQIPAEKCMVLNNALDPLLKLPQQLDRPAYLLERYGLNVHDKIVFTLTRLASTEQYKGYEQVIKAVARLKNEFTNLKYVLAGQYDEREEARIRDLIAQYDVNDQIIMTGFINDAELEDHFLLADLFVLPSRKEGFGIVFIEAMACGLPVICGNSDGSVDAIKNGELGTAINVDNLDELTKTISHALSKPTDIAQRLALQQKCKTYFNVDSYSDRLEDLLRNKQQAA